jgi:hypothetical protein
MVFQGAGLVRFLQLGLGGIGRDLEELVSNLRLARTKTVANGRPYAEVVVKFGLLDHLDVR